MATGSVEPRSFGLTFSPPSITLVYAIGTKLREFASRNLAQVTATLGRC